MPKYIKKKALKNAINCCTWYHINKNGELVEGANPAEDEPLYKYSDIKRIIKGLPTRKFEDEPQTQTHEIRTDTHECVTCRHHDEPWYSEACDPCTRANSNYEPQTDCVKVGKWYSFTDYGVEMQGDNKPKEFRVVPHTDCSWR